MPIVVAALMAGMLALGASPAQAATPEVSFAARADLPTRDFPYSVAMGDVNGDSFLDLAIANSEDDSASIRLGDGAGGFGPMVDFTVGDIPNSVALVDLDGDEALDLVAANYGGSSVSVLLGDGSGGFDAKVDFATNLGPGAVATGDLNGDTFLDLVVSYAESSQTSVSVLLGDGTGGFGPKTDVTTGSFPFAVALGDVNGDTNLDLVSANFSSNTASVLLGDGLGGFGPKTDFATGSGPSGVALHDLDGDLDLDLVVANTLGNTVSVRPGDGSGGFGTAEDFVTGAFPATMAVSDLNRDTFPDLAVSLVNDTGGVAVLLGDGAGGFEERTHLATGAQATYSVAAGDLNDDTFPDLAAVNYDTDTVSLFLNTTGTPPGAPTMVTSVAGPGSSFTMSWTEPANDGGTPITGYVVTPFVGFYALPSVTFPSPATSQVVTGLTPGIQYRFKVAAINAVGTGAQSLASNPVPPSAPAAPKNVVATAGVASATVSWTAAKFTGGTPITGYVVTPYVGYYALPSQAFSSPSTTQVVTGLTNGTQYRFRVQAVNAVGTSAHSKASSPVIPTP